MVMDARRAKEVQIYFLTADKVSLVNFYFPIFDLNSITRLIMSVYLTVMNTLFSSFSLLWRGDCGK